MITATAPEIPDKAQDIVSLSQARLLKTSLSDAHTNSVPSDRKSVMLGTYSTKPFSSICVAEGKYVSERVTQSNARRNNCSNSESVTDPLRSASNDRKSCSSSLIVAISSSPDGIHFGMCASQRKEH
eukprot:4873761-Amphidinium_carterae.1